MENNEKTLSPQQQDAAVQPAKEEKAELTELEKAKALFEYEMTEVLLCFKNEAKHLKAKNVSEYLDMDIPDAGLDYTAPDTGVKDIETDAPSVSGMPEMKVQEAQVAVNVIVPESAEIGLSFGADVEPKAQIEVPEAKALDLPEVSQDFEPSAAVSVPKAAEVAAAELAAPDVKGMTVHHYTESLKVSVSQLTAAELTDISVSVPEAKAGCPSVRAVTEVAAPKAAPSFVTVSEESFALAGAEVGEIKLAAVSTELPEIPDIAAPRPKAQNYPDVPEKPDFSAYYSDIIEAVRAEL